LSGTSKENAKVKHRIPGGSINQLHSTVEEKQLQCISSKHGHEGGEDSFEVRLDKAKHALETMNDEKDLREHIQAAVERRATYSKYLKSMSHQKSQITKDIANYFKTLREGNENLKIIAKAVHSCEIADIYTTAAQMHNDRLTLSRVKRFKYTKERKNPTPAQKALAELKTQSPTTPPEQLEEMIGLPSRNYHLNDLVRKGIIVALHDQLRANRHVISLMFSGEGEGFVVQLRSHATLLKEFRITRENIHLMENGWKNAALPFADELIHMNGFKLRRLLATIIAEGAL